MKLKIDWDYEGKDGDLERYISHCLATMTEEERTHVKRTAEVCEEYVINEGELRIAARLRESGQFYCLVHDVDPDDVNLVVSLVWIYFKTRNPLEAHYYGKPKEKQGFDTLL